MTHRIWIDVEDLFQYALANPRPSGIQRIEFELAAAFAAFDPKGEMVRFVRHHSLSGSFYAVPYEDVDRLWRTLSTDERAQPRADRPEMTARPARGLRAVAKSTVYRLPFDVRQRLIQAYIHQRSAVRDAAAAGRAALSVMRRPPSRTDPAARDDAAPASGGLFETSGSGDVLVALGSPWFHPDYPRLVERAQRERGLRFAMLVYDIIPLRRPEWCDAGLIRLFEAWFGGVLPLADVLLTISRASGDDIVRYASESKITLRAAPQAIPIGTGFTKHPRAASPAPSRSLPPPGYCLVVSTIEARKNHALLFRVWRRLIEEMPASSVPPLVFAGRVGWLIDDLMAQLRNARFLDGKIVLLEDPADAELERLYAGCRFTLFPSFYEGWGLPVTESLGFGRPCIISNATSLPEAGGDLARYFDPDNATEAYRVIRAAIEDPDGVAAWQQEVARRFRPVSWDESATAVLRACGAVPADTANSSSSSR